MPIKVQSEPIEIVGLRARAHYQLQGGPLAQDVAAGAASAHRVLFELASSPDTAADALALLHELQVHQVELTLQTEELRTASAEAAGALARQQQRYDHAPVALMTIDEHTRLIELNLTAAQHLGQAREALLGQRLDGLLAPHSAAVLQDLLARVRTKMANMASHAASATAYPVTAAELMLSTGPTLHRSLHAEASADPASGCVLLALTHINPPPP